MDSPPATVIPVPEIRDYLRINAEVVQALDAGAPRVVLAGVEGQRLLLAGLIGAWKGLIEIQGNAGPEFAAGLNAPGLTIVVHGHAADGAGRGLRSGRLLIQGDVSEAVGYRQAGGVVVVAGAAGDRAGLELGSGLLVLGSRAGRLTGERQRGGLIAARGPVGPHAGRGRSGGRLAVREGREFEDLTPEEVSDLEAALEPLAVWLPEGRFAFR